MKENTKTIVKKRRNDVEVQRRLSSIRSDQPLQREKLDVIIAVANLFIIVTDKTAMEVHT